MVNETFIKTTAKFKEGIDNLGRFYIYLLFGSAVIWSFIAINNVDTPQIFKTSLIYSILLIFAFIGVGYDKISGKFGLDTRLWEQDHLKRKLAVAVVFFAFWYFIFISNGFSVATASVNQAGTFAVNPTVNYFLITVLGPLAEDIFFFGVINITVVQILASLMKDNVKGLMMAGLMFASYPLFQNVPNSFMLISASAVIMAIGTLLNNNKWTIHLAFLATAFFVGSVMFPKFHSYAYQLNESHYLSASWFGLFMCLLSSYIGLVPVDLIHIANNMLAVG